MPSSTSALLKEPDGIIIEKGKEKRRGHHPSCGNSFISLSFVLMYGILDQKEKDTKQSSSAGLPASTSDGSAASNPRSCLGYPCREMPGQVSLGVTSFSSSTLPANPPAWAVSGKKTSSLCLSAATDVVKSVNTNRLSENSSNMCGGNKYTNNRRSSRLFRQLIIDFYILAGWNFMRHIKNGMYLKTAQIYSFH